MLLVLVFSNLLVPHKILRKAFQIWKKHPDQLVGYRNTARKHVLHTSNHSYSYSRNFEHVELGNSIVLPYGMIYHRDMLQLYMSETLRNSRELVDKHHNCDDILFNFVAANYTGKPPLILRKVIPI